MSWTTKYFHFDGIHSTAEISGPNQNSLEAYRYDAFGNLRSGQPGLSTFLFVGALGYYWDGTSDDTYIRARTYSAYAARFLSVDSLFPEYSSSPYAMADNSPVRHADPSGRLTQRELNDKGEYYLFDNMNCCSKGESGKYAYTTMWVLDKSERDGFIIQCVRYRINATRCDGTALIADDYVSTARTGKTCPPSATEDGTPGYSTYCEVWRVKGGEVFEDAWERTPQKKGGTDTYSFAGTKRCSDGCIAQAGIAWFIPVDPSDPDAFADVIQRLKANGFGYGTDGVANAGGLLSGCVNSTLLPLLKRDVLATADTPKSNQKSPQVTGLHTTKLAGSVWNCCATPCTCGVGATYNDIHTDPATVVLLHTELEFPGIGVSITPVAWRIR
jgi:RHS repeat-associated protein